MITLIRSYRRLIASVFAATGVILTVAIACNPMPSTWGLDAIETMVTPPDPALTCPVIIPADTPALADQRKGCAFGAGSHAAQSLGIPAEVSAAIPIRHVIIVMRENRSFDHLFGKLHDQGQPAVEAVPDSYVNPDLNGVPVPPYHETNTCIPNDPTHQSASMLAGVDGGKMDGFVKNFASTTGTDGRYAMATYENTDLPFYYWLASTFALGDRHFAPMVSGTYGVRNFMMFGTNAGIVDTGIAYPDPNTNSIFRTLMNAGYTWGSYTDDAPMSGALNWTASDPGVHPLQDILDQLDQGTLPNVAFVDGRENIDDDHPPSDLQVGEAWTRKIYDHAIKSPQWPRLAILWTFDEGGGFADHVPPPKACRAAPSDSPFTDLGPRIPFVAISPWAKPHYVSHAVRDHTSITRFIETLFDLPALTARDANSDALLDLFDFSCGRDLTPPVPPAVGSGGCTTPTPAPSPSPVSHT